MFKLFNESFHHSNLQQKISKKKSMLSEILALGSTVGTCLQQRQLSHQLSLTGKKGFCT
jgi:hypothetical protein